MKRILTSPISKLLKGNTAPQQESTPDFTNREIQIPKLDEKIQLLGQLPCVYNGQFIYPNYDNSSKSFRIKKDTSIDKKIQGLTSQEGEKKVLTDFIKKNSDGSFIEETIAVMNLYVPFVENPEFEVDLATFQLIPTYVEQLLARETIDPLEKIYINKILRSQKPTPLFMDEFLVDIYNIGYFPAIKFVKGADMVSNGFPIVGLKSDNRVFASSQRNRVLKYLSHK